MQRSPGSHRPSPENKVHQMSFTHKTELKDEPGDKCPRTLHLTTRLKGRHHWDYSVPGAMPPWIKEMRRCVLCGAMQALSKDS